MNRQRNIWQRRPVRIFVDHDTQHISRRVASENASSCKHLVKDAAECPKVGSMVHESDSVSSNNLPMERQNVSLPPSWNMRAPDAPVIRPKSALFMFATGLL